MNKQKQAKCKGYQARLNNKPITDNPYLYLPKYKHLAGFFDSGWLEANSKINTNNLK
jgi:hypothetical protein